MHRIAALLAALTAASLVFADGGVLIARQPVGRFVISIFGPSPLRVGVADISVMVQRAADQSMLLDAGVLIHLSQSSEGKVTEVVAPATHAKATNKLLYAAPISIPTSGIWKIGAEVTIQKETATVFAQVNVLPQETGLGSHWPYIMLVPLVIVLFLVNRWLRRRREITPLRR